MFVQTSINIWDLVIYLTIYNAGQIISSYHSHLSQKLIVRPEIEKFFRLENNPTIQPKTEFTGQLNNLRSAFLKFFTRKTSVLRMHGLNFLFLLSSSSFRNIRFKIATNDKINQGQTYIYEIFNCHLKNNLLPFDIPYTLK